MKLKTSFVVLASLFSLSSVQVVAQTLEERIDRLERISQNPVLLQHSQRLNDQQRELQQLYDELDQLKRQLHTLQEQFKIQNEDLIDRMAELENRNLPEQMPIQMTTSDETLSIAEIPAGAPVDPMPDSGLLLESPPVTDTSTIHEAVSEDPSPEPAPASLVITPVVPDIPVDQAAYDQAFGLLREGKYDEALEALIAFNQNHPSSHLASNGFYWLGEAYLIKQNFGLAFEAFNRVRTDYPKSNKEEDALLRGADALVGLNRLDEAIKWYRDLIAKAPESRAGKSAKRRLDRIQSVGG
jgi:tol-pal system protein YbgF